MCESGKAKCGVRLRELWRTPKLQLRGADFIYDFPEVRVVLYNWPEVEQDYYVNALVALVVFGQRK
jgi:hypothetical protein